MQNRPWEWMLENAQEQDQTAEAPPRPSTLLEGSQTARREFILPEWTRTIHHADTPAYHTVNGLVEYTRRVVPTEVSTPTVHSESLPMVVDLLNVYADTYPEAVGGVISQLTTLIGHARPKTNIDTLAAATVFRIATTQTAIITRNLDPLFDILNESVRDEAAYFVTSAIETAIGHDQLDSSRLLDRARELIAEPSTASVAQLRAGATILQSLVNTDRINRQSALEDFIYLLSVSDPKTAEIASSVVSEASDHQLAAHVDDLVETLKQFTQVPVDHAQQRTECLTALVTALESGSSVPEGLIDVLVEGEAETSDETSDKTHEPSTNDWAVTRILTHLADQVPERIAASFDSVLDLTYTLAANGPGWAESPGKTVDSDVPGYPDATKAEHLVFVITAGLEAAQTPPRVTLTTVRQIPQSQLPELQHLGVLILRALDSTPPWETLQDTLTTASRSGLWAQIASYRELSAHGDIASLSLSSGSTHLPATADPSQQYRVDPETIVSNTRVEYPGSGGLETQIEAAIFGTELEKIRTRHLQDESTEWSASEPLTDSDVRLLESILDSDDPISRRVAATLVYRLAYEREGVLRRFEEAIGALVERETQLLSTHARVDSTVMAASVHRAARRSAIETLALAYRSNLNTWTVIGWNTPTHTPPVELSTLVALCRSEDPATRGAALRILSFCDLEPVDHALLADALSAFNSLNDARGSASESTIATLLADILQTEPEHARQLEPLVAELVDRLLDSEPTSPGQSLIDSDRSRDLVYWAALTDRIVNRETIQRLVSVAVERAETQRFLSHALATAAENDADIAAAVTPVPPAIATSLFDPDGTVDLGLLRLLAESARVDADQQAVREALIPLQLLLHSGQPEIEYTALRAIGDVQRDAPNGMFLDDLEDYARHSDEPRRRAALYALAQYARVDSDAVVPTIRAFADAVATGSGQTRLTALAGIVLLVESTPRSGAAIVVPVLEESLFVDDATERTLATWLLLHLCGTDQAR